MSSWKKAAKSTQKIHRERHQPESRAHLGILEKKKDFIQRARNFQNKQKSLKILKKKALERNPDEFFFHMINSKVEDGVHHTLEKDDEHTPDQIKLMQSQDLRYVTAKRTLEARKIEKLQAQLHLLEVADRTENNHIFFVDTSDQAKLFDVAKHLDTHPDLLPRRTNRLRMSHLKNSVIPGIDLAALEKAKEQRNQQYRELEKRMQRESELALIERKLDIKRHLQDKSQIPKRIKPATKDSAPIYEWKYERKR